MTVRTTLMIAVHVVVRQIVGGRTLVELVPGVAEHLHLGRQTADRLVRERSPCP